VVVKVKKFSESGRKEEGTYLCNYTEEKPNDYL
jgi:hypothetical protein